MPDGGERGRQPGIGEGRGQTVEAHLPCRFEAQERPVPARRLLDHGTDDQRLQVAVAPVARPGEGQPGDDPGHVRVGRRQVGPPWRPVVPPGQGQDAHRCLLAAHRLDDPADRFVPGHGGEGPILVPRQVPIPAALPGHVDGDGKRPLEGQGGDDQLAPHANQLALGKRPLVAGHQTIQDFGLARRPYLDLVPALEVAHLLHHRRAAHDQVMEGFVDGVDLLPQRVQ